MEKTLNYLQMYTFDDRYKCDENGIVSKTKNDKKMSPFITRDSYVEYVLTTPFKTKKHIQAQRIVAGLFIPLVEGKTYVNHKDGNRQNNNVNNLEWVTAQENIRHSFDVLGKVVWNKGKKLGKREKTFVVK